LLIGETQTLAAKHLAQDCDSFFLECDDRLLVPIDPARKHQHHELRRRAPRFRLHWVPFYPE